MVILPMLTIVEPFLLVVIRPNNNYSTLNCVTTSRLAIHHQWWTSYSGTDNALELLVRCTFLVIVLHVLDAGERCLGRERVALGSRVGVKLIRFAGEDVWFAILF
jgi:hypothetical protein